MLYSEEVIYMHENTRCIGFLAYDTEHAGKRPGIMLAHDWVGRDHDICEKAKQIAALGFVTFAIDMYGEAKTGQTKEERRNLMYPLRDNRPVIAERMNQAHLAFKQLPQVDSNNIAVLGYCFGGLCALDLARSGADIKGVISFHGLLTAPQPAISATIKAKILILHGYDDPLVPPAQIDAFAKEMNHQKADWQLHMYGLTKHSFTNPKADDAEMGLHYDATADRRSWQTSLDFLNEILTQS